MSEELERKNKRQTTGKGQGNNFIRQMRKYITGTTVAGGKEISVADYVNESKKDKGKYNQ